MQHDIITTKVGMGMQNINDLFEAYLAGFRPLSRYGWVPTPYMLYPQRDSTHKIVPTWELS